HLPRAEPLRFELVVHGHHDAVRQAELGDGVGGGRRYLSRLLSGDLSARHRRRLHDESSWRTLRRRGVLSLCELRAHKTRKRDQPLRRSRARKNTSCFGALKPLRSNSSPTRLMISRISTCLWPRGHISPVISLTKSCSREPLRGAFSLGGADPKTVGQT